MSGRIFTGWWEGSAKGRLMAPDGTSQDGAFTLVPGYGAYDGLAIAFNPAAGPLATALHGPNAEDWSALVGSDGTSGPPIEATASPVGTNGNFNPRIAAHATRREWPLVSVRNFATVVGQRLKAQ
ncbi:MAG: hypothetical protein ACYC8T_28050 [Myxococcaceae bacterium]